MNSIRELSTCKDFTNQGFSSDPTPLPILYLDNMVIKSTVKLHSEVLSDT